MEPPVQLFESTESLPDELLVYIFTFLNLKDLISSSLVNKRWFSLASDNRIWENIFDTHYKYLKSDQIQEEAKRSGWKYTYLNKTYIINQKWSLLRKPTIINYKSGLYPSCLHTNGKYLVCGTGIMQSGDPSLQLLNLNKTIDIWDLSTHEKLISYQGHTSNITDIYADANMIATSSRDGTVKIWPFMLSDQNLAPALTLIHKKTVNSVKFNEYIFGTACSDGGVYIFDLHGTPRTILKDNDTKKSIRNIDLMEDGKILCSQGKYIRVWDLETETCMANFEARKQRVTSLQYDAFSKTFLTTSGKYIEQWSLKSGKCHRTLHESKWDYITCMTYDDNKIVAGGLSGRLWVVDWNKGLTLNDTKPHSSPVYDCKLTGAKIISCSQDQTIAIFDSETGDEVWGGRKKCSVQ